MASVWGIHNDTLTNDLADGGFVSIGWDKIGDLSKMGSDREALKAAQKNGVPGIMPGAVRVQAGTLYRFAFVMNIGDVFVAPYRSDSTINIGIVTGPYYYDADAHVHRHRRPVGRNSGSHGQSSANLL